MKRHRFKLMAGMLSLLMLAGCASDTQLGRLDSGDSFCGQQYRGYREGPPTPSGLSKEERARYEERTTDYHVSQGCQREAKRSVTLPLRRVPGG